MTFHSTPWQIGPPPDLDVTAHPVEATDDETARGIVAYEGEVRVFGAVVFTHRFLTHSSVPIDDALHGTRAATRAACGVRIRDLLARPDIFEDS